MFHTTFLKWFYNEDRLKRRAEKKFISSPGNEQLFHVDQLIKALGRRSLPTLAEFLRHGSTQDVHHGLIERIASLGGEEAGTVLVAYLHRSLNPSYFAAHQLCEMQDPRAFESLIWLLNNLAGHHETTRRCVVEKLGELGDSRAVTHLIDRLGGPFADEVLTALETIVEQNPHSVTEKDLIAITNVEKVYKSDTHRAYFGTEDFQTDYYELDLTKLKRLASQELARRRKK